MKRASFVRLATFAILLALGLSGCSRTVDDVANWKAKGNVPKLIKALQDPKMEVRLAAAEALGELKAPEAVDALAALFNDAEEEVLVAAVQALASIGTESITTPMIAALKLDPTPARLTAAETLGVLKAASAIDPLAEALNDSDESVQCAAATSIGQIGDEKGSAPLAGKLDAPSEKLKMACVAALGKTGGETGIAALIKTMGVDSGALRKAAAESIILIGKPAVAQLHDALKNDNENIRRGTLSVLRKLKAEPTGGEYWIWLQLAKVSTDNNEEIDTAVVGKLFDLGATAIPTLLEAVAHNVADYRNHAFLTLEKMGKDSLEPVLASVMTQAKGDARAWFDNRSQWHGAPSWRIDLWAALAAHNPQFDLDPEKAANLVKRARAAFQVIVAPDFKATHAYIPLLIDLLGDDTKPPPEQPDYDASGMPIIKKRIDRFRGEANQEISKQKLQAVAELAAFPLLAALSDGNELISGNAALLLGELADPRAEKPLMGILEKKIAAGEHLSNSPFYVALQKLDSMESEPVLKKIRPNADRAIRTFERKYQNIRAVSAETNDTGVDPSLPITFRIGYIAHGRVGELPIKFIKDGYGDWMPSHLPTQLP